MSGNQASSVTLRPYQVVVRPLVTEKNVRMSEVENQYAFEVHPQATKADIKNAVEELFHVKVTQVRTQSRVGKPRRSRLRVSHTPSWKKAVVTLAPDSKINFF